ncbi:MFS general substrate transporter [Wallemia mellicola]|uniref:MFS general substrate transporter n=1 Tax=Wallemia mellicola TaxID=1708541 RepID=A0AB74KC42_9BASI|nr:MFS general substrate transporter [Wallemia mellicola]
MKSSLEEVLDSPKDETFYYNTDEFKPANQSDTFTSNGKSEEDLVLFEVRDPLNPFNYNSTKKWFIFTVISINTWWLISGSTIFAPATPIIQEEFGTSSIAMKVPIAMYLVGSAFGPVLLISLSEDYGRKIVAIPSLILCYIFFIPQALAHNVETIAVCRFLSGFFGSVLLNYASGIPDLWRDETAGLWGVNLWSFSCEAIMLGSIIGAYTLENLGWRWNFWIQIIIGVPLALVYTIFVPETRGSVILINKTKEIRKKENPNAWTIYEGDKRDLRTLLREVVFRPIAMLFTEPIIFFFSLYDGLNYGLIYLLIESMPLVFEQFGIEAPNNSLLYLSILTGNFLALPCYQFQLRAQDYYTRKQGAYTPEMKLMWGFVGAVCFPLSLYWYAFTGRPEYNYWLPLIGVGIFGFASHILFIFVSDYTIESYASLASSAVTGQSFCREIVAAMCALITHCFYTSVDYPIATAILAAMATASMLIPPIFYIYGPRIRAASRYSLELKRLAEEDRKREEWITQRSARLKETKYQPDYIDAKLNTEN